MSSRGLLDLLNAPWAIEPAKLLEMQAIYATHLRGEKIDIEAIEARLGRPLANEQQAYTVQAGGVAVLPVEGVIAPKANLFIRISGGASAQMMTRQVESALADSRVRALVLQVDSPGGSVLGTPELAQAIHEMAAIKPIVTVSDGTMASAAYWIGSAANAVYISGPTVNVGSIGVVATHDYSPRRDGGQTVEITAGRYKRVASDARPLDAEGQAYLQEKVDYLYQVFVDAVARNRGTDAATVLERMADGRVFIGQQAIDAGLVDGVSTVDALVEQLATDPGRFARRTRIAVGPTRALDSAAGVAAAAQPQPDPQDPSMPITLEQLQADAPQLLQDIRSEGAVQERARIQAVLAQSLPGHEALVQQLAFDGQTSGDQAAAAVLCAERQHRERQVADLRADVPRPLPHDASAADAGGDPNPQPAASPMARAHTLAQAIAAKQAQARTAGRTLNAVEALAQIQKEL